MSTPLTRHLGRLAAAEAGALPDDDLVARFADGRDPAAFEVLVWRHGPMVWAVCRRVLRDHHDAEDAFQATFLALAREAARVRGVAGWLHRAAFHVALKAKARKLTVSREAQPSLAPDDAVAWREVGAILDDEVARLPDRYRAAFVLCCLEGLPNSDAARQLGCPTGTIDSRLSWARRRLRDRLTRRGVALGAVAAGALPPELARAAVHAGARADLLPLADAGVRAMNRSWLKAGAMFAAAVAVAGVALAALPPTPKAAAPVAAPVPPEKPENQPVSLILVEGVPGPAGTIDTRRLVRVRFRAGVPDKPEVLHAADQRFFGHFGGHRVVGDRYVVTKFGAVFDLTTGKWVREDTDGDVLAVEGGKVVYRVDRFGADEGVFAFDLATRKVEKLARIGEGPWSMVGVDGAARSPDGKAVVWGAASELKVYRTGEEAVSLGKDFTVEQPPTASIVVPPPVLWLDNDRVVTQTGNGKLVVVDTRTKARTLIAPIADVRPTVSAPTLTRDPDGRIVYSDWLNSWAIDVAKRTAERVGFRSVGHGFEAMRTPPWVIGWAFRYQGAEIGKFADGTTPLSDFRATDYYFAAKAHGEGTVVVPGAEPEKRPGVRVWSAATKQWVTLDIRANSVVGWVADAAPVPKDSREATLLMVVEKRALVRYRFRGGAVTGPEEVWRGNEEFFNHMSGHRTVGGRYVVTAFGGVLDATTGKVVHDETGGRVFGTDGDKVVYWLDHADPARGRERGLYAFDLARRELAQLSDGYGLWEPTGARSPGGKHQIRMGGRNGEMVWHTPGRQNVPLGNDFRTEFRPTVMRDLPRLPVPVLWLDDDRVLVQVTNGRLATITRDGARTPVVEVPAPKQVGSVELYRDAAGRVVYECDGTAYRIDVAKKSAEPAESRAMGHGFECDWRAGEKGTAVRHGGRPIGTVPFLTYTTATTAGYVALPAGEAGQGLVPPKEVRVWSAATGQWTTLRASPTWLGWLD